jgi:hypothetical protein
VCVRPERLTAAPRETRPGPNQISAALLQAVDTPAGVRLHFAEGLVVQTRGSLDNCASVKDWIVEFPAAELRAL